MFRNMSLKVHDRNEAIRMRKHGKSYREIMAKVQVSKGTLSKWLSNIPLTKKEERFLIERSRILQDNGRLKAALKNRERNERRRDIYRLKAKMDFEKYKDDPFFVLGLSLYWAEGGKSGYFSFINSDIRAMQLMVAWSTKYLPVEPSSYKFRLYIHKPYAHENCERFWSRKCAIPLSQFQRTIYKPTPHNEKRNPQYKGCLRMIILGVEHLVTVCTWQDCLSEYYVGTELPRL